MNIGEKIKFLRLKLDLTQEELAAAVGTKKQTIHKYETGIIVNIPASKIKAIADKLDTTPAYLMGWEEENADIKSKLHSPTITEETVEFPILGEIAAGYDMIASEDWSGETVEIPLEYLRGRPKSDYFVLRVHGDSMYPQYQDNDIVLILKQTTLNRSGEIGAVLYEDDIATLKKIEYVKGEDWLELIPLNLEFKPKRIEGEDLDHCRILGIPKLLLREI